VTNEALEECIAQVFDSDRTVKRLRPLDPRPMCHQRTVVYLLRYLPRMSSLVDVQSPPKLWALPYVAARLRVTMTISMLLAETALVQFCRL
jgi:hypothetical protein